MYKNRNNTPKVRHYGEGVGSIQCKRRLRVPQFDKFAYLPSIITVQFETALAQCFNKPLLRCPTFT